ncbi:MAG: L-rhamnose mutarotase, partial [Acidobacteria bacterium]|nr:L-rhamnose mutarotase [Acidobacteriota bacterium]
DLKDAGIRNYSIFRRDLDVFLYLEADDFETAWQKVEAGDANRHWQEYMAPIIEQHPSRRSEERFAMLKEVFHLE